MLRIRLLGTPGLVNDGEQVRLEGRKTWALLTYLLLESRPPTRRELVGRLWSEADDPLGAARWTLSQVRKALGDGARIVDREGRLAFEPQSDVSVDARQLLDGAWDARSIDDIVSGELLEGMEFDEAPEFARWLGVQRARVSGAATDALRSAANVLARSEPARAIALAERGLLADPFDDSLHALIVELHVRNGSVARARGYISDVSRRYHVELGVAPPATLARALDRAASAGRPESSRPEVDLRGLLHSAHARSAGGDFAGAFATAQRVARDAAADGNAALEMEALISATNYRTLAMDGEPNEWNAMLRRAFALASQLNDRLAVCEIERERGRIAALQGSYGAAEAALRRSLALATELGNRRFAALARLFLGICETDRCDYASAEDDLRAAVAEHRAPEVPMAWLARLLVKTARYDEAGDAADRAIELCAQGAHVVQLALALAVSGQVHLAHGDDDAAAERFARSFTVAQETSDHDWMALSLRGLALVDQREARPERARKTMREALAHATARPACYRWVEALVLADLCEMEHGADPALIERGSRVALAAPMPDIADRFARLRRPHTPVHTVAL